MWQRNVRQPGHEVHDLRRGRCVLAAIEARREDGIAEVGHVGEGQGGGAGGAGCRGGGEGGEEAPALDGGAVVDCDEGGGGEVGCVCVCEGVGCPEGEGEEEEGEEVHGVWVLGT